MFLQFLLISILPSSCFTKLRISNHRRLLRWLKLKRSLRGATHYVTMQRWINLSDQFSFSLLYLIKSHLLLRELRHIWNRRNHDLRSLELKSLRLLWLSRSLEIIRRWSMAASRMHYFCKYIISHLLSPFYPCWLFSSLLLFDQLLSVFLLGSWFLFSCFIIEARQRSSLSLEMLWVSPSYRVRSCCWKLLVFICYLLLHFSSVFFISLSWELKYSRRRRLRLSLPMIYFFI